MKLTFILGISLMLGSPLKGLGQNMSRADSLAAYMKEVEAVALNHQGLWSKNLYGPLLLVDPASRKLWANEPDNAGLLVQEGDLFIGHLPVEVNIAYTALNWSGRRWAMLMLPLPTNKNSRINLLAHELFHRIQPELGFQAHMPDNNHLDKREGRIYLRLELEALKEALAAESPEVRQKHISHAMLFRKYRHSLYPAADSTENLLELNEGLAEYTGLMMSGRTEQEVKNHLLESQQEFLQNPTYVLSFAYQTIPAYGTLLAQQNKRWNQLITPQTHLSSFFQKAFGLKLPDQPEKKAKALSNHYKGKQIEEEENQRALRIEKQLQEFTRLFVEQPHLLLPFHNMSISFDPRNLLPLEGKGTVYPNLRVSDVWGVLVVEEGALISSDWSTVVLSRPTHLSEDKVKGKGWVLELKEGYLVEQDSVSKNYILKKK